MTYLRMDTDQVLGLIQNFRVVNDALMQQQAELSRRIQNTSHIWRSPGQSQFAAQFAPLEERLKAAQLLFAALLERLVAERQEWERVGEKFGIGFEFGLREHAELYRNSLETAQPEAIAITMLTISGNSAEEIGAKGFDALMEGLADDALGAEEFASYQTEGTIKIPAWLLQTMQIPVPLNPTDSLFLEGGSTFEVTRTSDGNMLLNISGDGMVGAEMHQPGVDGKLGGKGGFGMNFEFDRNNPAHMRALGAVLGLVSGAGMVAVGAAQVGVGQRRVLSFDTGGFDEMARGTGTVATGGKNLVIAGDQAIARPNEIAAVFKGFDAHGGLAASLEGEVRLPLADIEGSVSGDVQLHVGKDDVGIYGSSSVNVELKGALSTNLGVAGFSTLATSETLVAGSNMVAWSSEAAGSQVSMGPKVGLEASLSLEAEVKEYLDTNPPYKTLSVTITGSGEHFVSGGLDAKLQSAGLSVLATQNAFAATATASSFDINAESKTMDGITISRTYEVALTGTNASMATTIGNIYNSQTNSFQLDSLADMEWAVSDKVEHTYGQEQQLGGLGFGVESNQTFSSGYTVEQSELSRPQTRF